MKTKLSRFGRSSVSVILAVMMLLSTMLVGTVTTVNAAATLDEGTIVYVQVKGAGADWYGGDNNAFSAWVWGGTKDQWVQLNSVPNTNNQYFYFEVPSGGISSCLLHRKKNTMSDGWVKDTNYWNATGDITLSNTNNLIKITGWDNSSSINSNYQVDSAAKLDADNTSVTEGTAVTFTPSLTSNANFNGIKSVSYTVKKDSVDASSSDYSINGSKITFNKAGNYEVTANVIYNAKGFSDINKTATATTTVTVESSLTPVAESVTLTASPETVKVGNSVTLSAVATNPASSANLTYTFTKTSGGEATVTQNNDKLTVTPTAAGTYKYTVTVSADGYSPVTSNEVNFEVTEDASVVTDTRLISVLDGSKVMFYGGEHVDWKQTYFVAMNTKSATDIADKADMTKITKSLYQNSTSINFRFGILCVPVGGTYYMGHSGWAPNLSANVVAGDAFVIYNSGINDFKQVASDGSDLLLQSVSTGTKTATTTLSANKVATGGLLGVTTSTSAGSSSLGFANTFEYYVLNKTTNKFYKVTLSDGKLDTSAFTDEGNYEVKTVLKDANGLYVLADTDSFVISNKAKHSVTFGSNDANMGNVSVSDGTNSYTTSPASVEEGKEVTFTATANEGYKFDGWYSDADCTIPIDGASNVTYTVNNISQAVSAYAKFSAVSYDITKEDVTNYSVEVKESAVYNSTVSVTVTATDNAYEVNGITVTDKDGKAVNVSGGESGIYTFTMPASNVTVKANSKLKQIDAPTVKFNVVGQSTADAKVLGSTPITASYTAAENSTIVEGSEKVAVTDANGTTVSVDKYSLVKNTTTGDYTFTAKEPGTYKLSYTVTAKSNYDESMTVTNSPVSVTFTVDYTDTQNAYLALSKYVDEVKDTTSDGYTTDSYAAFSVALESAQGLLTGLPASDATNASAYTNAKTALDTAFSGLEKDVTYYISGRFEGHDWDTGATDMQFTRVSGESNLYKYETHKSVADLSKQVHDVSGNYDANQYFFITTGKGLNGTFYTGSSKNGNNFHKNTVANKLTLTTHTNNDSSTGNQDNLIVFNNTSDFSSNVVIYLDTSDKDKLKLYYSADIDPDYRITGTLANAGGWSHKFASSMKFDTLEADGSYSKEVSISDTDITSGKNYFRLINNDTYYDGTLKDNVNKEYGPYTETGKVNTDVNICGFTTKIGAYGTYWNNGTAFYFKDAGTYKIHYIYNTTKSAPDIWVEKVSIEYNVTVDSGVSATVDKSKAAKGEKVTITATPESGKVLDSVTVKAADGTTVETTVSGNTATFTMPDQDVTVTEVTFRDAKKFKVTFSSSNDSYGSVSATYNGKAFTSGSEVTEGDKVTFTAAATGDYTFMNWTVNGTTAASTDNPFTIAINSDTTVVANFDDDPGVIVNDMYFLYGTGQSPQGWQGKQGWSDSKYPKQDVYLKDGKYIVTIDSTSVLFNYSTLYFGFSSDDYFNNLQPNTSDLKVIAENPDSDKLVTADRASDYAGTSTEKFFGRYVILSDYKEYLSKIQIIYDPAAKTYTVKAIANGDLPTLGDIEITAKDGTIRSGMATIAALGDTTIEVTTPEGKTLKATDSYSGLAQTVRKVPDKSTVKVTTTIDESKTFAGISGSGYYVKGFSINGIFGGVLSQSEGKSHNSNVYTFEFTVNQELYNETKLEITPVYFLKDDSNCVYFYIENYEAASGVWGNTPACYVYYNGGSEAFGYYPGQPMVDYNGSIFTQIPKYVDNDASKKITGMTLNNYVWDDVHAGYNGKNQLKDNAQTYDYDDFVQISESGAQSDNIIYRYKYNTTNNNPQATLSASTCDPDDWEVFLDYQNYPTDIFGNKLGNEKLDYKDLSKVTGNDEYLSIISDGYQNNYIGKYATAWNIYNKAGNRVATIPSSALLYALGKSDSEMQTALASASTPSDFLPGKTGRDTHWATFKYLYENYKGVYAQINFEGAISGGSDYGNRLDGRWYYSQNAQEITGEIKIQYANTLDDYKEGDFHYDTFAADEVTSITGQTTGAEAYFTNPVNKVRKLTTTADNSQDYKFEVQATSTATYTFVGWYRLIDGDYKAINPSDISSLTGAVTRNSDVTLVARYIKTPGGSMTFHHALYTGENAGGGKATTEIQVVVKDSESKELYNSGKISGTASIDKDKIADFATQEGLTVTVTLYTTTKNLYNFNGYYAAENTTEITEFAPTGLVTDVEGDRYNGLVTTSEYTFSFNDYYTKHKDTLIAANAGTVYYNFYSDITSIKVPYKVQFSYIDRMGATKYFNKAGYVDPDNTSSYTLVDKDVAANGVESHAVEVTLTNNFILSLAPYESNLAKNLTWNETPKTNVSFDSSVEKSIASAVVESTQDDKTIHLNVYRDDEGYATPLENKDGTFVPFSKNGSTELPYNSVFYTQNDNGSYTYDITAPETYTNAEGKELKFMYWAIYADKDCKNLVIKAYNIDRGFSYVSYDNYWIVPVYGESSGTSASVKEVYASTQFMEATRNQWTADTADSFEGFDADSMASLDTADDFIKGDGEDKLYADFVLNFFYNGKQLNVFDPNSKNVQTGIVMQKLDLDTVESGWGYNTDMEHYANKYSESELSAAADDAKNKILTGNSEITSLTKQIDNSRLNNKNRLQYYARFNNTESNANCVYRVYTYVKYVDESDNTVVELGDPIYFTLYDVANATV